MRPALRGKAEIGWGKFMDEFTVYILESEKVSSRHYIGSTRDIGKRLKDHNEGLNRSTKFGIPWEVIYTEKGFKTRRAAEEREREFKSWKGGLKLKELFKNAGIV